jgi:hypothetical protein
MRLIFLQDYLRNSCAIRVYARKGAPVVAMTATATGRETQQVVEMLGLKTAPVVIHTSPVQTYHKFSVVRRPANGYGLLGRVSKSGALKPGLWQMLERLYLAEYLSNVAAGRQTKRCIIYFKNNVVLGAVYRNLQELTGQTDPSTADFAMCHSSLLPPDEKMLQARRDDITLYLASNKLLLGTDLKKIDIVIFTAPFDQLAALVQGAGRMSRRTGSGLRGAGQVYQLWNGSDLTSANQKMTAEMRQLCTEGTTVCTKALLEEHFRLEEQDGAKSDPVVGREKKQFQQLKEKLAKCHDTAELVKLLSLEGPVRDRINDALAIQPMADSQTSELAAVRTHCCHFHDLLHMSMND